MALRGDFLKSPATAIRPEDVAQAIVDLVRLDSRVLPVSLEPLADESLNGPPAGTQGPTTL